MRAEYSVVLDFAFVYSFVFSVQCSSNGWRKEITLFLNKEGGRITCFLVIFPDFISKSATQVFTAHIKKEME